MFRGVKRGDRCSSRNSRNNSNNIHTYFNKPSTYFNKIRNSHSKLAQVAMEYMVIVGFVALITIPLILIFQDHSISTTQEISINEARQISKRIADAAETVYYLGKPSKTVVKAYFPANVNNINISNHEILFVMRSTLGNQEVYVYTSLNISGNISSTQGIHQITVENKGGYIWVSE